MNNNTPNFTEEQKLSKYECYAGNPNLPHNQEEEIAILHENLGYALKHWGKDELAWEKEKKQLNQTIRHLGRIIAKKVREVKELKGEKAGMTDTLNAHTKTIESQQQTIDKLSTLLAERVEDLMKSNQEE